MPDEMLQNIIGTMSELVFILLRFDLKRLL